MCRQLFHRVTSNRFPRNRVKTLLRTVLDFENIRLFLHYDGDNFRFVESARVERADNTMEIRRYAGLGTTNMGADPGYEQRCID